MQEHQLCSSHIQTPAEDESERKAAAAEQVLVTDEWQQVGGNSGDRAGLSGPHYLSVPEGTNHNISVQLYQYHINI